MSKVLSIAFLVALVAAPGFAQLAGTLGVDLVPGAPVFGADNITVEETDGDIDKARTVNVGDTVSTLVRLNGAQDLLGVTFDFGWAPANLLSVADIRETRMDLNFGGQQEFDEISKVVEFFLDAFEQQLDAVVDDFRYSYNDGTGDIETAPGVLMDFDTDGNLSFPEISTYVDEFLSNFDNSDVPFWTEVVSRRNGFNESVEIFDTVADINAASSGTDNTAVLLRRPETVAAGFGFDGDAIVLEIVFNALAAGDATISITNAQGIDENFADINTDVQAVTVDGPSVLTVQ